MVSTPALVCRTLSHLVTSGGNTCKTHHGEQQDRTLCLDEPRELVSDQDVGGLSCSTQINESYRLRVAAT